MASWCANGLLEQGFGGSTGSTQEPGDVGDEADEEDEEDEDDGGASRAGCASYSRDAVTSSSVASEASPQRPHTRLWYEGATNKSWWEPYHTNTTWRLTPTTSIRSLRTRISASSRSSSIHVLVTTVPATSAVRFACRLMTRLAAPPKRMATRVAAEPPLTDPADVVRTDWISKSLPRQSRATTTAQEPLSTATTRLCVLVW